MILFRGMIKPSSRLSAFSLFFPGSCPNNRDRRSTAVGTNRDSRFCNLDKRLLWLVFDHFWFKCSEGLETADFVEEVCDEYDAAWIIASCCVAPPLLTLDLVLASG
jgi:hypothetical protein